MFLNIAKLSNTQYYDMIETFEMLLSYWVWLKKDEYWECNNMESLQSAKNAICQLVNKLKQLFPCSTGSWWKISKVHE